MAEVVARMMRNEIAHLQDSTKAYGTLWIMYSSIQNHYCSELVKMIDDYTYEVFVEKKEGAYEEWKALITKKLEETEQYATTPKDCHRLLTGAPVDPAYEQSKDMFGTLMKCGQ